MTARIGRPPKPPEEKLGSHVMVRLTRDERARLEEAVGDKSTSDYVRRLLLRHLERKSRKGRRR